MSLRPILCVVGASGSGKTTLLERLVSELRAGGVKVGVVKHAAHGLEAPPGGKDSSRLSAAGASPAIVSAPNGVTVQNVQAETSLLDLSETFCRGCDLVLAEGYKRSPHDKIVVAAGEASAQDRAGPGLSSVRLLVSGAADPAAGALSRDDTGGIAKWVRRWLDRRRKLGKAVSGAILVGGQSRRMGTDKAALRFRGRSVLASLAELLAGRLEEVWTIGRRVADDDLPRCLRWHGDIRPGCGPLGGIATALRVASAARERAVLAVACDMPALAGEAVDLLLEQRRPERPATAFRNPQTGKLEPLAAVYEGRALPEIERALAAGDLSATKLLASLDARVIDLPPTLAGQLANVNTPEDLNRMVVEP